MSSGLKKVAQVAVGAAIGFVQGGPIGAVIGAGLAFYSAQQQEKLNTKSPIRENEPSAQTVRSSKAPVRFILGRVSTGGVLVWAQEEPGAQANGEWLHLVYVLCEGAIDALEEIYLGEELISTYGADASYELVVNPTQVNAFLKANCPDWKDSQIGRGLSFVRLSLRYNAEKFPSGIPDARFVVRGRNDLYDPRTGTAGWSENTALHLLWFLRTRCKVPDDEIVFETFASGANVCDEGVGNPDGTVSPRYRSSAVIGADEQRTSVLQKLEAACAGKVIRVGGRWMFQAGAYYGPYDFEITEDMVIGTVTGNTEPTNDAAINTVRGTFIDPTQSWAETDYPEVSVQAWVEEDGGESAETLSFPYVPYPYQAQRLANIELRRRRSGGVINVPLNLLGYNCRPGRAVLVNLPSLNIKGEFVVTNWSMGTSEGCTASLQAYEPAIFDDAVGQPYDPIGFIKLPAGGLGSPTGLSWDVQDASEVQQGVLSWDRPAGIVAEFAVTIRQNGVAVQALTVPESTTRLPVSGLKSGVYTMGVSALGPMARSGEATITVDINGPPVPETVSVHATIDAITLVPGNTLRGLNGGTYEYFWSANPAATEGEYLGQGLSFTHAGLSFATGYAYFVRSKNAYGVSAFIKIVASTSADSRPYLDAVKGQITESLLGKQLTEKIEKIELIDGNGPGSVNERLGEVRTELDQQIGEVSNHVNEVQNVLQEQIDGIADLADSMPYKSDQTYTLGQSVLGDDGTLYQAKGDVPKETPPPNTAYWTDIGQAVQTANGLAARVSTQETKVESLEGASTAQSRQIVGLQTSLTTTNGNVATAQQAAQDAASLAGGKGKVIVQSSAPATGDRLAQNLWIDTTGGANTPKRWNGSAWAAVTDKVATDAAAAAAQALSVAQSKADASVVQSIGARVTDAEGKLTSQGQAITGLQGSLRTTNQNVTAAQQAAQAANDAAGAKGKVLYQAAAPAAADRLAQNLWIDTTNNANTPKRWNGSAWAAVSDKVATDAAAAAASALSQVATKAEAAAVQALSQTVEQQGSAITANGQALTRVNASLSSLGASGVNLVPAEYCAFTKDLPAGMYSNGKVAVSTVPDSQAHKGYALKALSSSVDSHTFGLNTGFTAAGCNMGFKPGKYLVSFYARSETAGHIVGAYARVLLADGSFKTSNAPTFTLTTSWDRYAGVIDLTDPVYNGNQMQLAIQSNRAGVANRTTYFDRFMFEAVVNDQTVPSVFSMGSSFDQSIANAQATTAISGRVSRTEQELTSVSGSMTVLVNNLGDAGAQNWIYNPSFEKPGSNGLAEGWAQASAADVSSSGSLVVSQLAPAEFAQRLEATGLVQGKWARIGNPGNGRIAITAGTSLTVSAYVRGTTSWSARCEAQFRNASGSVIPASNPMTLTPLGEKYARIAMSTVAPEGTVACDYYITCYGSASAPNGYMEVDRAQGEFSPLLSGWKDNADVLRTQQAGLSTAVDSLASSVSQQGSNISSVSNRTTSLENTVSNPSTGLGSKASASALTSVSNRVSANENSLSSASSNIVALQNTLGGVSGAVNLIPAEYCIFGSVPPAMNKQVNLVASTLVNSEALGRYQLRLASSNSQSNYFYLGSGGGDWNLKLKPGKSYILSFWVQADAARVMSLRIRYVNSAGGITEVELGTVNVGKTMARVSGVMTMPANLTGSCVIVFYQNRPAGTSDHVYDGFMLEEQVGNNQEPSSFSVGTSARETQANASAISAIDTKVTQQGAKIESEAKRTDGLLTSVGNANSAIQREETARTTADAALTRRTDGLQSSLNDTNAVIQNEARTRADADSAQSQQIQNTQASLGDTNAAVQQVSQAQANLNNHVAATWSVKLGLTSGGTYYAAGFGLGLENQGGTFQSSFVVLANRFAVLNPIGEGLVNAFTVENGQVVLADALISKLTVQRAIVQSGINSSELANDGTPIMRMDFATGTIIMLNKAATAYTVYNRNGMDMVINGVRRFRVGDF